MRKSLRKRVIKGTASILSATIILVSGGYSTVCNIFGITKKDNKRVNNNNPQTNTTQIVNIKQTNKENNKYEYKYTHSKEDDFIYELETTEAISQEENVNRLIRKRKKETQEKVNI